MVVAERRAAPDKRGIRMVTGLYKEYNECV